MLKKVLLMAAVVLLGLPGLAHAQLGRGEISVGYGVAPVTDWIDAYSDKLLDVLDMKDLKVGMILKGTVRNVIDFGAFVDIGGVDGMVHISELSWNRIKHPSEVVSVGDQIEVYIKALDPEKRKISLGYKKVEDNPWEILRRDYPVGSEVTAKVVGMTAFGAFAQIIPGIDGLIHISQIADHRIEKPQDVLSVGEEVRVKITDIDFDKKRVSLSIRALLDDNQADDED